jgi:hypothetical protein
VTSVLPLRAPGRLVELELVVEQGLATFVDVGNALLEIRDSRLYRGSHDTFEDYLEGRWSMSRQRGYQLIDAARVSTMVDTTNERQARELVPLLDQPDELRDAWQQTQERTGGQPTAAAVRDVVQQRLPGPKTADRIARETGMPQASSDGYIYTGVDPAPTDWVRVCDIAEELERLPSPADLYVPEKQHIRDEFARALDSIERWIGAMRREWDVRGES